MMRSWKPSNIGIIYRGKVCEVLYSITVRTTDYTNVLHHASFCSTGFSLSPYVNFLRIGSVIKINSGRQTYFEKNQFNTRFGIPQ